MALIYVPVRRAVKRFLWLAPSFVFTKNVPKMEHKTPMAANSMGTPTPCIPKPAATASALVDTIEPT